MAWADLTDCRAYYEVIGEGEPLMLIPGLGATCRLWDPVVPELAKHFTLIMLDNRGMGLSKPKRKPRTLADYSADYSELLDHLGVDQTHVLGLSLGGIAAQRLAIDHPQKIKRLILMSCADRFSSYLLRITSLLGHSLRRFPRMLFLQTMELLATAPLYLDEHADEIDRTMREKCSNPIPKSAMATQLRCLLRSEVAPADYRITAPTLVIAGEYDALIPSCYAKIMANKIPGSHFVLLKAAGHNPLSEMPDLVLPMVIKFLRDGEIEVPEMVETRAPTSFHLKKQPSQALAKDLVMSPSKGSHK
ncbi:MAG TPA: alpha/beta hydrolase [Tepidisphaeraceae bacterium]|jgi:pimeloyl-ACP methyl ester carboxylesterase|nr:alpha/beta hydrolase [Tepidisphaeraceae bacterium]